MKLLTGNMKFTEEKVVFDKYIKQWRNKDIIFQYLGYGGERSCEITLEPVGIKYLTEEMDWEHSKKYEAIILEVTDESMTIKLKDTGYIFSLDPSDFRNRHKYEFDIYEIYKA